MSRQSMNNYRTTLNSKTLVGLQHSTITSNSLSGISQLYTTVFLWFHWCELCLWCQWSRLNLCHYVIFNAHQRAAIQPVLRYGNGWPAWSLRELGVWINDLLSSAVADHQREIYTYIATSTFRNTDWTPSAFNSEFCSAAPNVSISLSACEWQQWWHCESSDTSWSASFLYVEARAWYLGWLSFN